MSAQIDLTPKTSFLDLPPELRNEVYRHAFALIDKQMINIVRERKDRLSNHIPQILAKAGKAPRTPEVALLLTCRQIHCEVVRWFYEECHFGLWIVPARAFAGHGTTHMLREISLFQTSMFRNLKYVKHLDFGLQDLIPYIDAHDGPSETSDALDRLFDRQSGFPACYVRGVEEKSNGKWTSLIPLLRRIADSLPNITSLTYHDYGCTCVARLQHEHVVELKKLFPALREVNILFKRGRGKEITSLQYEWESVQ